MKVLFLILCNSFCLAQNMSFVYEMKYHINVEKPNNFETSYMMLDVAEKTSIFRENHGRTADSTRIHKGNRWLQTGFENQFYVKKDLAKNKISKIISNREDDFLLPIEDDLQWNISSEKKKIGTYNAQKATLTYGGREWTAWFTNDISIHDGPYIFNGLPGLIVSIADSTGDYNFHLIQTKKFKDLYDARVKALPINWSKYEELAKSYYQKPFGYGKVTFLDKDGNPKDDKEIISDVQKGIKRENNPIELNHKIDY
ncbi:GLPGLI family protein [Chryseobacterium sp. YIM B02567]|uniref:GLPGLI family protein n=2 Tax=Chryseobacterium paridis TaxID=2800328 RepID=A0ABS1FT71_9FLAO|nr:GLPGLI family protein [Chryseobacterium paridis]MBK1895631.1 GLPGLI family protein [Chryseobacterium paridis]